MFRCSMLTPTLLSSSASASARFLWPATNARSLHATRTRRARRWSQKTELPFQAELKNPINAIYGGDNTHTEFGFVYDKKPFRVEVKKYHVYDWCGCGTSSLQPFCDKNCEHPKLKRFMKGGPVKYIAPRDADVWFCNCKQTKNRPFCDGSHRSAEIQEEYVSAKFELWEPREKKDS